MKGYTVHTIKREDAIPWIKLKHYAKRIPSISHSWGLVHEKIVVGVLTIGKPASPSLCVGVCGDEFSDKVYELNRLCINSGHHRNALSFFVGACLRRLHNTNPKGMILVSYADSGMEHIGYIYQATNWIYTGLTKSRTDIGAEDGTHSRHYDKDSDYTVRKSRSAKHRYVIFLGKNKRFLKKNLKYPILPYPKGESKRYDASATFAKQVQLFA